MLYGIFSPKIMLASARNEIRFAADAGCIDKHWTSRPFLPG